MGARSRLGASGVLPGSRREPAADVDKVPVHAHAAQDLSGLGVFLFPATVEAVGATANPTTNSATMSDLDEMQVTVTPPATFPVWECALWFDGSFSGLDTIAALRLVEDPTGTPTEITRNEQTAVGALAFTMVLAATVLVQGGSTVEYGVQWASLSAVTLTSTDTLRHLRYTLRPYQPAAV